MFSRKEKIIAILLIIVGIINPNYKLYFLWPLLGSTILIGVVKLYGFIAKRTPDDIEEDLKGNKETK